MPDHKNHCLILYFAQHTAGEHIHIRLRIRLRIRMSPLLHRNDKNLTYKLEVDPSILVGRANTVRPYTWLYAPISPLAEL